MPVATTTPRPRPLATPVPLNTMFVLSATSVSAGRGSHCLETGALSPVSGASAIRRVAVSSSRQSAPTASPSARSTISPGTRWVLGMESTLPSRTTLALVAASSCSASTAFVALASCQYPITALAITMIAMTIASIGASSAPSKAQAISEMTIAKSSKNTRGSLNCSNAFRHFASGGVASSSFKPYRSSRRSTSCDVRPALASVSAARSTWSDSSDHGHVSTDAGSRVSFTRMTLQVAGRATSGLENYRDSLSFGVLEGPSEHCYSGGNPGVHGTG